MPEVNELADEPTECSGNCEVAEDFISRWKRVCAIGGEILDENERLKAELAALRQRPDDAVVEALTPSAETKAAYIGEFYFLIEEQGDDAMCPVTRKIAVPWTTIKEIMAAIRERAILSQKDKGRE